SEQPLKITISDDVLDKVLASLKRKLDDTHLPGEVNAVERAYRVPHADTRRLANRWKGRYDWHTHEPERKPNPLPMFAGTRTIAV
ncbi:hypothetical protein EDB83DRAFT_2180509, partial [Lactarius deliciosus]